MTDRAEARRRFRRQVREAQDRATRDFQALYSTELEQLRGLSPAEIEAIAPETADRQVYEALIAVVEEASRVNLAQADLRRRIEALGELAVRIAGKVPGLARLLPG